MMTHSGRNNHHFPLLMNADEGEGGGSVVEEKGQLPAHTSSPLSSSCSDSSGAGEGFNDDSDDDDDEEINDPPTVKKFDISTYTIYDRVVLLAPTRCGKTVMMRHLVEELHMKNAVDMVIAMSGSDTATGSMRDFLPPSVVHTRFNEDVLMNTMDALEEMCGKEYRRKRRSPRVLFILDDVFSDTSKIKKSPAFLRLFEVARNYHCGAIVCTQFPLQLPPRIRSNATKIMAWATPADKTFMKNSFDNYFACLGSLSHYSEMMKTISTCGPQARYNALVCDKQSDSVAVEKCITWYRAPTRRRTTPPAIKYDIGKMGIVKNLEETFERKTGQGKGKGASHVPALFTAPPKCRRSERNKKLIATPGNAIFSTVTARKKKNAVGGGGGAGTGAKAKKLPPPSSSSTRAPSSSKTEQRVE